MTYYLVRNLAEDSAEEAYRWCRTLGLICGDNRYSETDTLKAFAYLNQILSTSVVSMLPRRAHLFAFQ